MKRVPVMMGLALAASAGVATADPGKDESGKGRERASSSRELRFDRDEARGREDRGREDRGERSRRTTREFKEEYDDGRCKVERKLERSGEYKEGIKCRPGGRRS